MWLISIQPNLCVALKQRWGNSEQPILHMAACWVDPMNIGGASDCVFNDCYGITLFINEEGPHLLTIVKQTMNSIQSEFGGFFQGHMDECKTT